MEDNADNVLLLHEIVRALYDIMENSPNLSKLLVALMAVRAVAERHKGSSVLQTALCTLVVCVSHRMPPTDKLPASEFLPSISEAMILHGDNGDVQGAALFALSTFAHDPTDDMSSMVEVAGRALEKHVLVESVQEHGLRLLFRLDSKVSNQGELLKCAVRALANLKHHVCQERIQVEGLALLADLALEVSTTDCLKQFVDVVQFVLRAHPHSAALQRNGVAFLRRLANNEDLHPQLKGCTELVCSALSSFPNDKRVQELGMKFLGCLTRSGDVSWLEPLLKTISDLLCSTLRVFPGDGTVANAAKDFISLLSQQPKNKALLLKYANHSAVRDAVKRA